MPIACAIGAERTRWRQPREPSPSRALDSISRLLQRAAWGVWRLKPLRHGAEEVEIRLLGWEPRRTPILPLPLSSHAGDDVRGNVMDVSGLEGLVGQPAVEEVDDSHLVAEGPRSGFSDAPFPAVTVRVVCDDVGAPSIHRGQEAHIGSCVRFSEPAPVKPILFRELVREEVIC